MAIEVGHRVEVLGVERGFEHSYYAARVLSKRDDMYEVEYEELIEYNGGPLLVEMVEGHLLRPYPPNFYYNEKSFKVGDFINVRYNDGWWDGVVHDVFYNGHNHLRYEVYFDYMVKKKQYGDYQPRNVRPHNLWIMSNGNRVWVNMRSEDDLNLVNV